MSPKTKLKLTYLILGIVYFVGGIENGVSIPRGWLHWHEDHEVPKHMVGLVVASYGFATFFVAPFVGRWMDRPGRGKSVLVVGTLLRMVGAALEYFLTHKWVNTAARFISGLGSGMDVAVLSETSRYTSHSSRTSAMALLVGTRLVGCAIVPGLDAVLWTKVLKNIHGHLPESKIAASGVSLLVLWAIVLFLTVLFYTELCRLRPLPQFGSPQRDPHHQLHHQQKHSSPQSQPCQTATVSDSCDIISNNSTVILSSQAISIPGSLASSYGSEQAYSEHLARSSEMIEETEMYINRMAQQSFSGNIAKPIQIEEVDRTDEQGVLCEQSASTSGQMSTSFNTSQGTRRNSVVEEGERGTSEGVREEAAATPSLSETFDQSDYVQRQSVLPRTLQGLPHSVFDSLYDELIRDDAVALLTILMSGTFSHLCFQMLIVPTTQWFLGSGELYIVIIFTVSLLLLMVVCMLMWWFNPQRRAVGTLLTAGCVLIVGNILCMLAFSFMTKDEEKFDENVILISASICVFVIGVPLLLICGTSIYTQRSRKQHHGLRQGVYHSVLSLSAILAPLWVEGTITQPYLHHGVIISLLLFSLGLRTAARTFTKRYFPFLHLRVVKSRASHSDKILVFCSHKRLTLLCHSSRSKATMHRSARRRRPAARRNSEEQPLLS